MNKFVKQKIFAFKLPWEIAAGLLFNLVVVAVFLVVWTAPASPPVRAEITVSISDFQPAEIRQMEVPASHGVEDGGAAPQAVRAEQLTESAMRDFSPDVSSGSIHDKTASERLGELAQTERGIRTYEQIGTLRSGLPEGILPAGLQTGASFQERTDPGKRVRALRRHGGGADTESAVERGLRYLAGVQNRDGSWGSKESFETGDAAALTALALLAFFSHGENFQSEKFADNIRRGCDFLVEMSHTSNIEYAGSGFGHAILTYALAEGYAVSGSLSLRQALEQRLNFILARQNVFGSFALNYDNTPMAPPTAEQLENPLAREIVVGEPACDLSLLGWHIQAMTAARNAGVNPEGLDRGLELATEALIKIHQAGKGGFSQGINMRRFEPVGDMNPVGLLGLQLLNAGRSAPARRAEKLLKEAEPPRWNSGGKFPLYRWYYQTQAIFQSEKGRGTDWEKWNENLKRELLAGQSGDGSWALPGGDDSFRVRNRTDLAIYGTSLCALMLQVYYRYLPSYSIAENADFSSRAEEYDLGAVGRITRLPGGADPLAGVILGLGENDLEPIAFGQFDGRPEFNDEPWVEDKFKIYASMRSTVPVRTPAEWPQTLQPNQRLALFLDELIPPGFKGHLRLMVGVIGSPQDAFEHKQSLEAVLNGKRLYHAWLRNRQHLVELIIPSDTIQPFNNILQLRNTGSAVLAFDAARITAVNQVGQPLYLLAEEPGELQPSLRPLFQTELPADAVICRLNSHAENRQLLPEIEVYDPDTSYIAEYAARGHEHMGDQHQLHYLRQTGREIVDWIAGGGAGVRLREINSGGKLYDSVFGNEYPALAALRRAAKLFGGTPPKLAAQYYPRYGDKPQLFGSAAASYNAPGVATVVVAKRFPVPEEGEVVAIVPWSGATEVVIEKGFLPEGTPFAGVAPKIETETKTVQIENNIFRYICSFPEMTVIRLRKSGAREPTRPPIVQRDSFPAVEFDHTSVRSALPAGAGDWQKHSLRNSDGHVAAFGPNASFRLIPATRTDEGPHAFIPPESTSVLVTQRANADMAGRNDSVFLALGKAPPGSSYLSFQVYPRTNGLKRNDNFSWAPLRFIVDRRCFSASLMVDRWQQVVIPLDGIELSWKNLRIIGPGRVLQSNLQSISYEINDMAVWTL